MVLLTRILVPLDGLYLGSRALPYAVTLGRAAGGRLLLARAIAAVPDPAARQQAEAELAAEAEQVRRGGVAAETLVLTDDAGQVIAGAARTEGAGLIVMATRRPSGLERWLIGSVADHVLRHAEVPVLLVPDTCEGAWPARPGQRPARVLVSLDGSALAEEILGPARALGAALGAALLLVRVVTPPATPLPGRDGPPSPARTQGARIEAERYLEALAQTLRTPSLAVETHVAVGSPVRELAELARERGSTRSPWPPTGGAGWPGWCWAAWPPGCSTGPRRPCSWRGRPLCQTIRDDLGPARRRVTARRP
jgi:nucleotide-binding universal stress UspA family protein